MAAAEPSLFAQVRDLFAELGPITIRRMFGGAGVYAEGRMFALLAEDTIYLKVDPALKADLGAAGSQPFVWRPDQGPKAGQAVEMSYWRLPDSALDDPEEACQWARRAVAVAQAAALTKPKPKAKPQGRKPRR